MRVLELIFGFQLGSRAGGILRFSTELSRALIQRGFDIHLGGLFDFGTPIEKDILLQLRTEGIDAFCAAEWNDCFPQYSFCQAVRALWDWQSCYRAKIIHSHSEFSDVAALILKFHPTRPFVVRTVHYPFRKEWRKRPLRRILLTNLFYPLLFDSEVGINQTITDRLNSRFLSKILRRRALCIYNAIDLNRFRRPVDRKSKRESLNIPNDAPLVGTIGRLTEQKGFSFLIDAIPIVLKERPDVHFIIVGDGELSEPLRRLTISHGVNHRVVFTGPRSDIEEIFACLDLFVLPSLWEGLPTVILESMAANVPVVATDIPGTRDLIRDGYNGWLVPPGNAYALAEAILDALKNEQLSKIFAQRAQNLVTTFSIDSVAKQYEQLFLSLVLNPQVKGRLFICPKG